MIRILLAFTFFLASSTAVEVSADDKLKQRVFLSVDKLPAGGSCDVAILLEVAEGWHVYSNPAAASWQIPTTLTVTSQNGTKLSQTLYPSGDKMTFQGDEIAVYEGRVLLFATLSVPESAAGQTENLSFELKYQPCNSSTCLAPTTSKKPGAVPVTAKGETAKSINPKIFALKQAIAESGTIVR